MAEAGRKCFLGLVAFGGLATSGRGTNGSVEAQSQGFLWGQVSPSYLQEEWAGHLACVSPCFSLLKAWPYGNYLMGSLQLMPKHGQFPCLLSPSLAHSDSPFSGLQPQGWICSCAAGRIDAPHPPAPEVQLPAQNTFSGLGTPPAISCPCVFFPTPQHSSVTPPPSSCPFNSPRSLSPPIPLHRPASCFPEQIGTSKGGPLSSYHPLFLPPECFLLPCPGHEAPCSSQTPYICSFAAGPHVLTVPLPAGVWPSAHSCPGERVSPLTAPLQHRLHSEPPLGEGLAYALAASAL